MKRYWRISFACFCSLLLVAGAVFARPAGQVQEVAEPELEIDVVGDVDGTNLAPQKALQDTVWIADWPMENPIGSQACTEAGWVHVDNHILNDGINYWHIETGFTTATGMAGNSYAVGYHGNVCCTDTDGYDNDWYQGIRMTYSGVATISLDYIVDSEAGFDFLQVETDSLCLSYARVNFNLFPNRSPAFYRNLEVSADGLDTNGGWDNIALSNYGVGTHCVYIAFFADGGYSPCDGDQPTTVGEGAVVDNIVIVDGSGTRSENFEDGVLNIGTSLNMADSKPFGTWARLYAHVTDNDVCAENTTCAWLFTDHTTPTLFNDPSMSFGPGGYVIKGWLDDIVVGPWVSLSTTQNASGTVLNFRRFPGNNFSTGAIVQNWSVRGKGTIQGQPCVTGWGHASSWNSLSNFVWQSLVFDMSPNFDPTSEFIQIRHRTSDWQWIAGAAVPTPYIPGPGPFTDRTRIGRRVLTGPVISEGIDSRSQGQDCFPTEIHPGVTPAGQHFRPTTDRFGTCAFSEGTELGINKRSPNLITGDSIWVNVQGLRTGGTIITSITFNAAIVRGPHRGCAPPPYTVGPNGFFSFNADSVRSTAGSVLANNYFADLNDFYFKGGDELWYFWAATDNGGGFTSDPVGMTAMPGTLADAMLATSGLHEVSFLPTIAWPTEDCPIPWPPPWCAIVPWLCPDPNPCDMPPSGLTCPPLTAVQVTKILYVNNIATRRRAGDQQRTSFMYTMERLGYVKGIDYDVYDHQGMGNTNNQLGGRATIQQCQGYNLIAYDNGNGLLGRPLLPNGVNIDSEKINQAQWFRNWLAQVPASEAQFATLWIFGTNTTQEKSTNALIATDMGVTLLASDQGLNVNPQVDGVAAFTFDTGTGQTTIDFTGDLFPVNGGCPVVRNYDALGTSGTAVQTHRYRSPTTGTLGGGAMVMNRNNAGNWNTIMGSFPFFDIRDAVVGTVIAGPPPQANPPEWVLLNNIIHGTIPPGRWKSPNPTDTGGDDEIDVPRQTVLHQNVPNPFNPTTEISFDLAQSGKVQLRIYDVAGRLVRTLIDKDMAAGRNHAVVWNGLDDQNGRVASGVYFYRLDAVGLSLTKKMVVMK